MLEFTEREILYSHKSNEEQSLIRGKEITSANNSLNKKQKSTKEENITTSSNIQAEVKSAPSHKPSNHLHPLFTDTMVMVKDVARKEGEEESNNILSSKEEKNKNTFLTFATYQHRYLYTKL